MIYFIRAGEDGPMKIGWSSQIVARYRNLQAMSEVELTIVRVVYGLRRLEYWFHDQFARLHLGGEWFTFDPLMLEMQPPPSLMPAAPPPAGEKVDV